MQVKVRRQKKTVEKGRNYVMIKIREMSCTPEGGISSVCRRERLAKLNMYFKLTAHSKVHSRNFPNIISPAADLSASETLESAFSQFHC